ncbi:hypothetical protein EQM06_04470 [Aminipila luticellarii]|uniref:Uncharacterized protein n=2 Tax=Aminipila luticellarii TaxID=2507160 RepID=A0A410PUE0_9FIRM|nr:hypothetical protein EQM06_04470 [Aminipila luticellarii]
MEGDDYEDKKKKKIYLSIICVALVALFGTICYFLLSDLINLSEESPNKIIAGGILHSSLHVSGGSIPVMKPEDLSSERFQRPSKECPYPNPYTFQDFRKDNNKLPLISKKFKNPEDLILAYYGILQEASNMLGYSGGCGTIGWSGLPYPYSYELLTGDKQQEMPFDQYVDSFSGIGYTTLLKLLPAYTPADTDHHIKYYMVEIEIITGAKADTDEGYNQGSQFAYYYGLITVEQTNNEGWKIKNIYYIPEDFLCAPMHSWFYLSDAVVQIVYGENLKRIDKIDSTEQKDHVVRIYASGNGKSYRFDFVRLTNGYDILLHEYILGNEGWKETSLLGEEWKDMKLTINNSELRKTV